MVVWSGLNLVNVKLIIDAIAIPLGTIATIIIISKNRRNLANILFGSITFFGGVLAVIFSLLKEYFYLSGKINTATLCAKFMLFSFFLMTIPAINFSIFFWRAKYKSIPRYLHFFAPLPALGLSLWLFLDKDILDLVETTYSVNIQVELAFTIISVLSMILLFLLLIIEMRLMAKRASSFPYLQRRMNIFLVVFTIGFGGAFISIYLFQFIPGFQYALQPSTIFIIFAAIFFSLAFTAALSHGKKKLWHGCPKLLIENGGETYCLNSEEGDAKPVKVLDLGVIIERIQIDTEILKTGADNCANTVFSNSDDTVCCLTTHYPIRVLNEEVSRDEMELARTMDIM
ncbi:MAG: hypothetical protein FK732_10140, partial [Asgard group archaeon]|nr:hypothetical protein [Asgard group archaeon]